MTENPKDQHAVKNSQTEQQKDFSNSNDDNILKSQHPYQNPSLNYADEDDNEETTKTPPEIQEKEHEHEYTSPEAKKNSEEEIRNIIHNDHITPESKENPGLSGGNNPN